MAETTTVGFKFESLETALVELVFSSTRKDSTESTPKNEVRLDLARLLPGADGWTSSPKPNHYEKSEVVGLEENKAYFESRELTRVVLFDCVISSSTITSARLTRCTFVRLQDL
jgi:hypothetical protein